LGTLFLTANVYPHR